MIIVLQSLLIMVQHRLIVFVAVSITAYLTQIVYKRGRMWTKLSHIQEETFAFFNSIIEKLASVIDKKTVVLFVPVCVLFWQNTEKTHFYVNEVDLIKIGQFCAAP